MTSSTASSTAIDGDGKFHFAIDRGGTFTDIMCRLPDGKEVVSKLLSEDPQHYADAPTEGIRRLLEQHDKESGFDYSRGRPVITERIGSIRMGTTVATNALLERDGARMALLTTEGFADLLEIGNQSRPDIFDLTCSTPSLLYEQVVQVNERVLLEEYCSQELIDELGPGVVGLTGEKVLVEKVPDMEAVKQELEKLRDAGITALAVAFMHAFTFGDHEKMVGELARSMNCFEQISLSHEVMPMIKLVPRGHTTCAAAYLTPKITTYLANFQKGFDEHLSKVPLQFMKSDGGLAPVDDFGGHQAILSGPAGGVVGYAKTTFDPITKTPVIGFDMGGTSTDVSRFDGHLEHVFETVTAGVAIQAPQLDIHTVAAGGGSRLFLRRGMFVVGPESAGAHPGPICYRKNGFLAVTDANLVLGRVLPEQFPKIFGPNEDQPLDVDGARHAFEELGKLPEAAGRNADELAWGFLQVANEAMCRPIRNLTQMKGFDITTHILACFGGAGPQHACAMAKALGISEVFVHRYGGILSAYGLSLADAVHEVQEPTAETYHGDISPSGKERLEHLKQVATEALKKQGYDERTIVVEEYLNMRYEGTDNAIMIPKSQGSTFEEDFMALYKREFGFVLQNREILIDDYRVRAVVPGQTLTIPPTPKPLGVPTASLGTTKAYFENGWQEVPVYKIEDLKPGHNIPGPSIIVQPISTVVLEVGCDAHVTANGDLKISIEKESTADHIDDMIVEEVKEDPVQLSIFAHRFMGIAEQMGRTLQRTSISVNMKERLDFSCALFTKDGGLVANAPHIPVHLGAMSHAVRFQVEYWGQREGIQEGDVLVSNHPQLAGGSHLPDITVITPVFYKGEIIFFVASRGHHADIGGIAPGSMPPHSNSLEDEGAMIIAFKLVRDGKFQEEGITEILKSPGKIPGNSGTRNLRDNLSDLRAQVAANNSGIRLLQELVHEHGLHFVESYMKFIQNNAEQTVRYMLKDFAAKHGTKVSALDHMDDGSPIKLSIEIDPETGSAVFDFTGTGPQVYANHNAPPAVTYSAVIYSLRSLVAQTIPLNQGCLAPISFIIPENSLLNPSSDAGVVGGNVLTSQRVVDVVLKAFSACAASQGCMNNLTFGDKEFGYYETIAGGAGAGPTWEGRSGIHTHCTNTRITDPEILERRYPVLLREFSIRKGSGGKGKHRGGDGVIRELEPLRPLTVSILSERRVLQPFGMEGGEPGACGRNLLIRNNGVVVNMGGRCSADWHKGERLRIETPGAGGYGAAS
ncbi:hydantoinase B/oxoprolinase-domain containing protein [Nitzschia inconspicua]|uniref:Hydantoinase B/oxoprolinase-domain containing protein n=1 Tax=Nitzschia inconspicua TaxID=303405 RepID=A0A9K3LWD1_9STRA|nr:hydantoinase B/oxoprolinase-domain containing protein [Nitzschia inconspicua]